jgi:hypothetical protein
MTLAAKKPLSEHLAAEWHTDLNSFGPEGVSFGSHKRVWWKCTKRAHDWEASIADRTRGSGCPICANKRVLAGFNDLATLRPDLADEWDAGRNQITPVEITCGTARKAFWLCSDHGHSWSASVEKRASGRGCPICAGSRVLVGFNDLVSTHPLLAREWHGSRNEVGAESVSAGSRRKIWWTCSNHGHDWSASVNERARGVGCPFCSGKRVMVGFNDLGSRYPDLAPEWNFGRNLLTPNQVSFGSNRAVWWCCDAEHEWQASIKNRVHGTGCPFCTGRRIIVGVNDLATLNPTLVADWHPTRNANLRPTSCTVSSHQKAWWRCEFGHDWQASIASRSAGTGCVVCAGLRVDAGVNDLATTHPHLVSEWHPTLNNLAATEVIAGSGSRVWWRCSSGHEWQTAVYQRALAGGGCAKCCSRGCVDAGESDLFASCCGARCRRLRRRLTC